MILNCKYDTRGYKHIWITSKNYSLSIWSGPVIYEPAFFFCRRKSLSTLRWLDQEIQLVILFSFCIVWNCRIFVISGFRHLRMDYWTIFCRVTFHISYTDGTRHFHFFAEPYHPFTVPHKAIPGCRGVELMTGNIGCKLSIQTIRHNLQSIISACTS